jgi:hypothetical protein
LCSSIQREDPERERGSRERESREREGESSPNEILMSLSHIFVRGLLYYREINYKGGEAQLLSSDVGDDGGRGGRRLRLLPSRMLRLLMMTSMILSGKARTTDSTGVGAFASVEHPHMIVEGLLRGKSGLTVDTGEAANVEPIMRLKTMLHQVAMLHEAGVAERTLAAAERSVNFRWAWWLFLLLPLRLVAPSQMRVQLAFSIEIGATLGAGSVSFDAM